MKNSVAQSRVASVESCIVADGPVCLPTSVLFWTKCSPVSHSDFLAAACPPALEAHHSKVGAQGSTPDMRTSTSLQHSLGDAWWKEHIIHVHQELPRAFYHLAFSMDQVSWKIVPTKGRQYPIYGSQTSSSDGGLWTPQVVAAIFDRHQSWFQGFSQCAVCSENCLLPAIHEVRLLTQNVQACPQHCSCELLRGPRLLPSCHILCLVFAASLPSVPSSHSWLHGSFLVCLVHLTPCCRAQCIHVIHRNSLHTLAVRLSVL